LQAGSNGQFPLLCYSDIETGKADSSAFIFLWVLFQGPAMLLQLLPKFLPITLGWSSHGHAELTSQGVALGLAHLITYGKDFVYKQMAKFYSHIKQQDYDYSIVDFGITGHVDPNLTVQDVDGENARKALEEDAALFAKYDVNLGNLFGNLPALVVNEDVHMGNIPNVGEALEHDSQVRHFMRSRAEVTSTEAYFASRAYILNHLISSWSSFNTALRDPKGAWESFSRLWGPNYCQAKDFAEGLKQLAAALHTLEDSYAPGHVRRSDAEVIEKVNIWNEENQTAHDDWEGHHAYDEPSNTKSRPHFYAARVAVADCVFAVLANLDQDEGAARTSIGNTLDSKLIAVCVAD
jgi:hypothetical protein